MCSLTRGKRRSEGRYLHSLNSLSSLRFHWLRRFGRSLHRLVFRFRRLLWLNALGRIFERHQFTPFAAGRLSSSLAQRFPATRQPNRWMLIERHLFSSHPVALSVPIGAALRNRFADQRLDRYAACCHYRSSLQNARAALHSARNTRSRDVLV